MGLPDQRILENRMRTKKALLNTIAGLSYEAVALVCGMILPRLILSAFGSDYNGITNSISQFLGCIALLRSGIAGVTRAALYKPLAEQDNLKYSRILRATEIFMRKVALIFLGFICVFACVYPYFVRNDFDWLFTASLVFILGISTFVQYYFGFTYQMILNADQRQCVTSFVQIFTTILNTIVAYILIRCNVGIRGVKLGSAIVFALNPLFINYYAHKKYNILRDVTPDNSAISQRWDAFAHQVANFVHSNTDIMVLTVFTNMKEVSVYSVYYLVINSITRLLRNSIPGIAAAFGDMMARGQKELMDRNFRLFELLVYTLATVLFTITEIMLVPFVMLYTKGVYDVNYSRAGFALLISVAGFFSCARIPYQHVVEAAGHYKQTKNGAFAEAILNITISVALVYKLGLVGVAIGTVAATIFRTFQYAIYLSKNILGRDCFVFVKHILLSALSAVLTYAVYSRIVWIENSSFLEWAMNACLVGVIVCVITAAINLIFYKEDMALFVKKIRNMFAK